MILFFNAQNTLDAVVDYEGDAECDLAPLLPHKRTLLTSTAMALPLYVTTAALTAHNSFIALNYLPKLMMNSLIPEMLPLAITANIIGLIAAPYTHALMHRMLKTQARLSLVSTLVLNASVYDLFPMPDHTQPLKFQLQGSTPAPS